MMVEVVEQMTNATLAHGWYWVRYENSDSSLTEPQPALWDGHHWRGLKWSGQPLHGALVLEPLTPAGTDPMQGAADWLCKAFDEPSVATLQRQLLLGYNRAARLFAKAIGKDA